MADKVAMVHGSGGQATGELIDRIFAAEFRDQTLDEMEDSALVPGPGAYDGFNRDTCCLDDYMSEGTKNSGKTGDYMSEGTNISGKTYGHEPGGPNTAGKIYGHEPGGPNTAGKIYGHEPGGPDTAGKICGHEPGGPDTAGKIYGHESRGADTAGRLALTTDSFVVTPVKFRGGDIGRLAVCGTVNDLLMRGAKPMYLTCGWILEEGTDIDLVREMAHSMAETAREAGIRIVAGDTKVIEGRTSIDTAGGPFGGTSGAAVGPFGGTCDAAADRLRGGILINTAGVGFVSKDIDISAMNPKPGDAILVSGSMGDHHAAILSERMSIDTDIRSDNAPLTDIVCSLIRSGLHIHTLRDITRGGLATVLKELAESSGRTFTIEQEKVPVTPKVQDFCNLLGLDPVYMGNEGKLVCILPQEEAERALEIIRGAKYGSGAVQIGHVTDDGEPGSLIMRTEIGGERLLDVLQGEGLPRIC